MARRPKASSNVFTVGLTGQTAQGYTRTNAGGNAAALIGQGVAFGFMNPGASSASGLNAQATQSFSGLLAGNYDIVFQMRNGNARLAKTAEPMSRNPRCGTLLFR